MNTPSPCDECKNLYVDAMRKYDPFYTAECMDGLRSLGNENCKAFIPIDLLGDGERLTENMLKLSSYEAIGEILLSVRSLRRVIWRGEVHHGLIACDGERKMALDRILENVIETMIYIHADNFAAASRKIKRAISHIWDELIPFEIREDGGILDALKIAVSRIERWEQSCKQWDESKCSCEMRMGDTITVIEIPAGWVSRIRPTWHPPVEVYMTTIRSIIRRASDTDMIKFNILSDDATVKDRLKVATEILFQNLYIHVIFHGTADEQIVQLRKWCNNYIFSSKSQPLASEVAVAVTGLFQRREQELARRTRARVTEKKISPHEINR